MQALGLSPDGVGSARVGRHQRAFDVRMKQSKPEPLVQGLPRILPNFEPGHDGFIVVLGVHQDRRAELLGIGQTRRFARSFSRLGENREQNRCEDGDNGYHHQQLDERESMSPVHFVYPPDLGVIYVKRLCV